MIFHGRSAYPAASFPSRCAALAGLLAEHAITSLSLTTPSGTQTLHARSTDLPGLIQLHTPCSLSARTPIHLDLRIAPASIEWTTDSADLHAALDALLH